MKLLLIFNSLAAAALTLILLLGKEELSKIRSLIVSEAPKEVFQNPGEVQEYKNEIVKIKDRVLLNAPVVKQFPELPRGCEVTSLAMLLQYKGIDTNKMTLAEEIKKNTIPLKKEGGNIFWGHPNDGFIGDMYSYDNPGLGVYHKPIKELAEKYLPGQVIDLTGKEFSELMIFLSLDIPVWIITNTTYRELPESAFEKWNTPDGDIDITYKEHSVLITGYDEKSIYFNDPITGIKNKVMNKEDFLRAWRQMGSQAVTYLPE
ncbi:C39 family peptidase [Bacillus sp. ISL-47]|uniref:C39 family peptidase n=1 Tax=Bacillus sp. ISL-47 TaxID=2819130 RepID=UPI001BEABD62|nr:C39 family peptidase [Bacillus sp. ISL-47]MBT2690998.1 C39 family peptidase [Bacillus sp. ISL-47]MBT2711220.1 C39 family peptidase [Pseudomonas sp. ISL-84]